MEDREIVDLYWQRSELAISETERKYGRFAADLPETERMIFVPRYFYLAPVAVIGSGSAGMTVAIILAKTGYRVTIFEKRSMVGSLCGRTV